MSGPIVAGPTRADRAEVVDDGRIVAVLDDWSSEGHGGLSRRLAHGLRAAIVGGILAGGARLPPERHLATLLSVSRSTVSSALDELRGEGLVTSRQGRGTTVVGTEASSPTGDRVSAYFVHRGTGIDLAAAVPTEGSHLPPMLLRTEDLLAAQGTLEPHGLPALRTALARRQSITGARSDAAEIQVTHGAHHAVALVVDALVAPGDAVAVESPAYPGILDLVDLRRARPVELPSDRGGPVPEALGSILRRDRPKVVYLQTGVNNPTGQMIGPARRRALAEVLDDHGDAVVVEDNTLADLAFAGRVGPDLATLCRVAPIVTVESLSKVGWAALRIGWLRATGVVGERIAQVRVTNDLGTSVPSQLLALQILPQLDAIAQSRRTALAAATGSAGERIATDLPDWRVEPPAGSSALWAALPMADATPYVALARRHGVNVTPGSAHVVGGGPDPHLRLCVDRPANHVEEGIDRLVTAWRDMTTRRTRTLV